jgi:hypothetical protein
MEVNLGWIRRMNLGVGRHVVGMSTEDSLVPLVPCSDPDLSTFTMTSSDDSLESRSDPMSTEVSFESRREMARFRVKRSKSIEVRVINGLKSLGVWGVEESLFSC